MELGELHDVKSEKDAFITGLVRQSTMQKKEVDRLTEIVAGLREELEEEKEMRKVQVEKLTK